MSKINVIKLWNIILLYCSVSPCNYCLLLLQLANFVVSSDSVDRKNCHKFSKSTINYFLFYHQGGFIRKIEWVYQTQWGVSEVLSPNQTKAQRKSQWKTVWIQVSCSTHCSYMFCLCGYILEYCTNLSWISLRLDLDMSVVLWTKETDNLLITSQFLPAVRIIFLENLMHFARGWKRSMTC